MHIVPPALDRLICELCKLPGIGKKTATRLALYIMRRSAAEAAGLAEAVGQLHGSITLCSSCYTFSEKDPCEICCDHSRQHSIICVVEEPGDLLAIEKTSSYRGLYHILHGTLAPMEGIGPDELKINELYTRLRQENVEEVIIATSSTVPGEATASYLAEKLEPFSLKVSRLACGIPMGMDIKYADMYTLGKAIESRQSFGR
ncbi:recombination mediator RecR [Desulfogranum japonicum]|uniref:recombination mediator RecR n=1 Tax=Desulfogranum japonicum TaxID=231447 RepID=UPI000410D859|nr:recombination mediator RecR [Desulfogranum japonicum]